MKRVVADRFGGPEVLRVIEEPAPRPGPGQACVEVEAAGASFTDALVRAGSYLGGPKAPCTPGYEIVGTVRETGPGCEALRVGERVAALIVWGGYAEQVCLAEQSAVPVPEDLDAAQLVGLLLPYMTAYQLLHRAAGANKGETVLLHGAAGRVGSAVLELAGPAGLRVIGTASAEDRARVERAGALALDYRSRGMARRVRELSPAGVDIALDGIGGAVSLRSYRALGPGGRLVLYGHLSTLSGGRRSPRGWLEWYAAAAAVEAAGLLAPRRKVLGYRVVQMRDRHPEWFREDLRELIRLLREGTVRPVIAERMPLTDARRAHEMLESTAARGKLVLLP
ncbi:zinc-binding dehydrogenase [Streptomyces sp. ODS28]|uniref:zinc-binding dehydrogenase n=1 Tax=Streptomyces sp. ODS28 TaxID=3136688 RepID=UPI0031E51F30